MIKKCKSCRDSKPINEYHISNRNGKGVNDVCKLCRSLESKEKYKNKIFKYVCILKKSYCKKRNIPFDLDEAYLKSLWTGVCPVFGTELVMFDKGSDNQYQLDRMQPDLGYVKGNVCFISARANRIKYDASPEELERVLEYVRGIYAKDST